MKIRRNRGKNDGAHAPRNLATGRRLGLLLAGCLGMGWSSAMSQALPAFYDLNSDNLLTPTKNQGQLGSCWAFAATTAFQSAMLKAGLVSSPTSPAIDLSVWDLAALNGQNVDTVPSVNPKTGNLEYNGWGGFNEFAVGYWTRGRGQWNINPTSAVEGVTVAGGGPVMTSNNPLNVYPLSAAAALQNLSPYVPPASQTLAPYILSQSVYFAWDGTVADLTAFQDTLKSAILKYGAISATIFAGNPTSTGIFYATGTDDPNHMVVLAGWSDTEVLSGTIEETISGTTVNTAFSSTGGWLIQNSWGTAAGIADPVTGQGGYYWNPYSDTTTADLKEGTAFVVQSDTYAPTGQLYAPTVVQNQIYAPLNRNGVTTTTAGFGSGTASMAATQFEMPSNTSVAAFGLWEAYKNTTLTYSVYTSWGTTGPTGTLLTSGTVTLNPDGPGYNLVNLPASLMLAAGGPIYLVLDYGTDNSNPIPIDLSTASSLAGLSSVAGESWLSSTGTDWTDISTLSIMTGTNPDGTVITGSDGILFAKAFDLIVPLDNASGIDANYSFTVDGSVSTSAAANSINGLNFYDGGVLTLAGPLTVSNGTFTVQGTYATGIIQGSQSLIVPEDFTLLGGGTLEIASDVAPVNVPGNLNVQYGSLMIGNQFNVGQGLDIDAQSMLVVAGGALLNVAQSADVTNGTLMVGGRMNLGGPLALSGSAAQLIVNLGGVLNAAQSVTFDTGASGTVGGQFNIGSMLTMNSSSLSIIAGGQLNVGQPASLNAGSSLLVSGLASISNILHVNSSLVTVNAGGLLNAGQTANLNAGSTLLVSGLAGIGNTLNVNGSLVSVNAGGFLNVGQTANVNAGSSLLVNGLTDIGSALNVSQGGLVSAPGNGSIIIGSGSPIAGTVVTGPGASVLDNGQITANIVNAGLLNGIGLIAGNVTNNGKVLPGDDPGVLTIQGGYTQSSAGTLDIEVASLTDYGRLIISGAAQLGGTLLLTSFNGFQFAYGTQLPDFLVASSVSGSFSTVDLPAGYRGRLFDTEGDLTLLVAPSSYTEVAKNANQYNVAKALDNFIPASGDKGVVSTALDFLTAVQYPAAFDAVMPSFYQTVASMGLSMATTEPQLVDQRLGAIRLGASGFSVQGLGNAPVYNEKGADGKSTMDGKKDIITPGPDNHWGLWVQGNGIFGNSYSIADVPSYKFASGGFLTGGDYRWNEHFTTGIFTGYQGAYANYANGGKAWMNGSNFGGYATYNSGAGFYANAILMGGYANYNANRSIQFSTIDRTASSSFASGDLGAFLEGGYDVKAGGFTFGPLANAQYTYLGVAGFTERNAGSLDLAVGQQNVNSLQTNFGGHIAYTWKLSDKVILIPEVRMFWNHEYMQNPISISSSLNGGAGPSFGYETTSPARDSVFTGVGLNAQLGDRWNAGAYYNINFGSATSTVNTVSANIGFNF